MTLNPTHTLMFVATSDEDHGFMVTDECGAIGLT
jgi:hypothetical protein